MKKFITAAFCITLLLNGFAKIYAKDYDLELRNNCCPSSNSCDMAGCSTDCGNSSNSCGSCAISFDNNCSNSCTNSCSSSCNNSCDTCDSFESSCDRDCALCCATPVRSVFHMRSQGANTARELVGWQWEINLPFMCNNYGAAYFVYEYQRSFDSRHISNALFGSSTLSFAGSLVPNRLNNELLAENFGLAQDFHGRISFKPKIENHIFDFGYFQGFDCFLQGSYLRVHAPVVLTYWALNPCQRVISQGNSNFSNCFVDSTTGESTAAASSILEALSGNFVFGDMQTPWCAGKFDPCTRKKLGLADIDVILGYNYFNTDCYHLGIYAQLVMPSGPKYKDRYVFDPVVGNYGHFEVGAGISAHVVFWSCEDQSFAAFFEGNLTHMCKTRQCRLFDFQGAGAFSRYAILKEYDYTGNYTGNLINATCFNNRAADVSLDVKGDASVKFAYRSCNIGIDLGYNIYGHSSENVKLKDKSCDNKLLQYAIKGTAPVCCSNYPILCVPTDDDSFAQTIYPAGTTSADTPDGTRICTIDSATGTGQCSYANSRFDGDYTVNVLRNNSAQPGATAFVPRPVSVEANELGCGICLNQPVTEPIVTTDLETAGFILVNNTTPTKFVNIGDLNINSARSISVLTHKVFAFFNYQWFDTCGWNPSIGVGAEVEINDKHINDLNCKNSGLSQWGVFTKWNISF